MRTDIIQAFEEFAMRSLGLWLLVLGAGLLLLPMMHIEVWGMKYLLAYQPYPALAVLVTAGALWLAGGYQRDEFE